MYPTALHANMKTRGKFMVNQRAKEILATSKGYGVYSHIIQSGETNFSKLMGVITKAIHEQKLRVKVEHDKEYVAMLIGNPSMESGYQLRHDTTVDILKLIEEVCYAVYLVSGGAMYTEQDYIKTLNTELPILYFVVRVEASEKNMIVIQEERSGYRAIYKSAQAARNFLLHHGIMSIPVVKIVSKHGTLMQANAFAQTYSLKHNIH